MQNVKPVRVTRTAKFKQDWEARMNHYLRTGRALQAEA